MSPSISLLVILATLTTTSMAGFRCTLGQWACSASCVTLGQTSGICDQEGDCICSEKSIRSEDHNKLALSIFYVQLKSKVIFTNFSVWAIWRIFFHLDVILEKHSVKQPATLLAGPEASVLRTATTVSFMMIIDDDDIDNNFGRWMWWHIFVPIRVCPVCSGEHL